MARCSAAGRTSALPTAARGPSLFATAAVRPSLVEVGVFNTTATAVAVALARATATGTVGAAVTGTSESDNSHTVIATVTNTQTADATVATAFRQASLGAAIGSGCIWTFANPGVVMDKLTTSGIVIILPTGTGQHLDWYFVWDE